MKYCYGSTTDGNTKHLVGRSVPIEINSIIQSDGTILPSNVKEMHFEKEGAKDKLVITPEIISDARTRYVLAETDGYGIIMHSYDNENDAYQKMHDDYSSIYGDGDGIDTDMSFISNRDAEIHMEEGIHIWSIMEVF